MTSDTDLGDLIGSRICHDLISPIGAIGNGVELLTMDGQVGPELALIAESVANANARIRFYRVAFGHASGDAGLARSEILSILKAYYGQGRVKVAWEVPVDCRRSEAKAAFLALLCLETGVPFGGQIRVGRSGVHWQVEATSEKLRIEDEVWNWLGAGPRAELTPARVHFALLPEAVENLGRRLDVQRTEGGIVIGF
nr:histidine phosphotransferase family protein [Tropicimonas sp. IMCC34043]